MNQSYSLRCLWCLCFALLSCVSNFKLAKADDANTAAYAHDVIKYSDLHGEPYTVGYDSRSFLINNQRTIFLSGGIHYPRESPDQWRTMLTKLKNDGLNIIQTYVFWNLHEPQPGVYYFDGRANITRFLEIAAEVGLFVNLRVGPYVCGEWNWGGLPLWLLHFEDIQLRYNNSRWQQLMGDWLTYLITRKIKPFLPSNGGPIVMAQIENEYVGGSQAYAQWCGDFTAAMDLGIPWTMCREMAFNSTLNTVDGYDGYGFAQSHAGNWPSQPIIWTENEVGGQIWGAFYDPNVYGSGNRTPQDMAQSIAMFFAAGGAYHNYYMYYGGNHVGRWAAGSIANMYQDGANYHFDGLPHEPKRTHLVRLHNLLSQNNRILMNDEIQSGREIVVTAVDKDSKHAIEYPLTFAVYAEVCNTSRTSQQWVLSGNHSGGLLTSLHANAQGLCATATSNPIELLPCTNQLNQSWVYSSETHVLMSSVKQNGEKCIAGQANTIVKLGNCNGDPTRTPWNLPFWKMNAFDDFVMFESMAPSTTTMKQKCLTIEPFAGIYAYQYRYKEESLTFLVNRVSSNETLLFADTAYVVPQGSVSIIDSDGAEVYNTAKIEDAQSLPSKRVYHTIYADLEYQFWTESQYIPLSASAHSVHIRPDSSVVSGQSPLEQIRLTNGSSEFLFYEHNVTINATLGQMHLTLNWIGRLANVYLVFVDAQYIGQTYNYEFAEGNVSMSMDLGASAMTKAGVHALTILSGSLGQHNAVTIGGGPGYQYPALQEAKGLPWNLYLSDAAQANQNVLDLFDNKVWYHWVGLTGEQLQVYNGSAGENTQIQWTNVTQSNAKSNPTLTWFRTSFATPASVLSNTESGTILLDIGNQIGLKRGDFYLNGRHLGHYNHVAHQNSMVQRYYFIANDYFNGTGINTLYFCEQLESVDVSQVRIVSSTLIIA